MIIHHYTTIKSLPTVIVGIGAWVLTWIGRELAHLMRERVEQTLGLGLGLALLGEEAHLRLAVLREGLAVELPRI